MPILSGSPEVEYVSKAKVHSINGEMTLRKALGIGD